MEQYLRKSQKQNKPSKGKRNPIKIKYISSPMMVRANNASEFRAIVQELTGQNSNVSDMSSEDFAGDHDDQITSWFGNTTTDHDPKVHHEYDHQLVHRRSDVVDDHEKFSDPNVGSFVSFDGQFNDEASQFWRSDVVSDQSFNGGFQSPCVFV